MRSKPIAILRDGAMDEKFLELSGDGRGVFQLISTAKETAAAAIGMQRTHAKTSRSSGIMGQYLLAGPLKLFYALFLPAGFPESVSRDYARYQVFDSAFCSSLSGQLSTQAVLKGVGVGNADASVLAASMTWILRDGVANITRVVFAWKYGAEIDCDPKLWRLTADVLNDFAMTLELFSANFPAVTIPLLISASIFRAVVGIAGGCSRMSLTMHQARHNNMADVSAKDASQETAVNLLGTIAGVLLIPWISDDAVKTWIAFAIFSLLHIFANYAAVSSVVMETLNRQRVSILVDEYHSSGKILDPLETSRREALLWRGDHIIMGSSLEPILKILLRDGPGAVMEFRRVLDRERYFLCMEPDTGVIYVALQQGTTSKQQIRAYIQATILRKMSLILNEGHSSQGKSVSYLDIIARLTVANKDRAAINDIALLRESYLSMNRLVGHEEENLIAAQWNIQRAHFSILESTFAWSEESNEDLDAKEN